MLEILKCPEITVVKMHISKEKQKVFLTVTDETHGKTVHFMLFFLILWVLQHS